MSKLGESIKKGVAGIVTAAMLLYAPVAHAQPQYEDIQKRKEMYEEIYQSKVISTYLRIKNERIYDLPPELLKERMEVELLNLGAQRKYNRIKASGKYKIKEEDTRLVEGPFGVAEGDGDYCRGAEDLMEILKEDEETQNVYEVVQDIYSQNCLNPHTQKEQSDGSTDKPIESYSKAYREALKNTAEDIANSYEGNKGKTDDAQRSIGDKVGRLAALKEIFEKDKYKIRKGSRPWCDAAEDVMTEIKREHLEEREGSRILHGLYQDLCEGSSDF